MSLKFIRVAILATTLAGSTAAFAGGAVQTHHCKLADGSMDMKKSHKECTAAKGTWAKDAPADASKTPPKAPATPAPAPKK